MTGSAPPDLPGGGLGYALVRAAHAWRAGLTEALSGLGVTPPQFFVLAALFHVDGRDRPGPTQQAVAAMTGIDPNTTSQIIRGIERRGLIRRDPSTRDSRALELSLTAEGLELARVCTRRARALNREFFGPVDDPNALYRILLGLAEPARPDRPGPGAG